MIRRANFNYMPCNITMQPEVYYGGNQEPYNGWGYYQPSPSLQQVSAPPTFATNFPATPTNNYEKWGLIYPSAASQVCEYYPDEFENMHIFDTNPSYNDYQSNELSYYEEENSILYESDEETRYRDEEAYFYGTSTDYTNNDNYNLTPLSSLNNYSEEDYNVHYGFNRVNSNYPDLSDDSGIKLYL